MVVIRGEAGAGKTALLDDAVARARGLTVVRTRGADPEGEQRFAALAELCEPLLDQLARLPAARAAALASALGLGSPRRAVDRYAVYAGMLDLLTAAAEETPILVVVDDAHLLDEASAEAIPFIARRLWIDGIALLIATESDDGFSDAEELRLGGLEPAARQSRAYGSRSATSWRSPVVEHIVETGQGNPLALLEIARDLTPEQRRARAPLDGSLPPSAEWAYLRRIEALPGRHAPGAAGRRAPGAASARPWHGRAHARASTRPRSIPRSGQGSSFRTRRGSRSATSSRARGLLLRPGRRAPPRARRAGRRGRGGAAPVAPGPRRHRARRSGRGGTRGRGRDARAARARTRPRRTRWSRPRA